jgi:hypothetical protein
MDSGQKNNDKLRAAAENQKAACTHRAQAAFWFKEIVMYGYGTILNYCTY